MNGKSEFPFPVPVEILSTLALVPCSRPAIGFDFGFGFGFGLFFADGITRAVQNTAAYRGATPDKKAVNLMTPIAFLDQQINRNNVTRIVHLFCTYMPATGVALHFASLLYCTVCTVQSIISRRKLRR